MAIPPENEEIRHFRALFLKMIDNRENPFHPLVFIKGDPKVGKGTYIGLFSEINASGADVIIGDDCDIASFVSINVSDSHRKCLGLEEGIERKPISIGDHVFIGSHCFVKGGARIGHHSVVAAGTIVEGVSIPPNSLVYGNPMQVRKGYYRKVRSEHDTPQQADY
jgi:acetyltransferase-like isoleucine patch superfamily enzyme